MKAVAFASIVIGSSLGQFQQINCPPGFELQGKKCQRNIQSEPVVFCARGQLENGVCIETGPLGIVCPPGTTSENANMCKMVQQQPALQQCPAGYEDRGNFCIRQIPIIPIEVCTVGRLQGGQCVLEENAQPIRTRLCPSGFQEDGKNCARFREYDCTVPNEPKVAPHQTIQLQVPQRPQVFVPQQVQPRQTVGKGVAAPVGYLKAKRMLGAKKTTYNWVQPAPVSKGVPMKAVQTLPANEVKIARQVCQEKEFAPFVTNEQCPVGYKAAQGLCQRVSYFPITTQCPNGLPLDQCYTTETAQYLRSCANGQLTGNACETSRLVPKQQTCPEKMTPVDGICVARSQPQRQCPPGLVLQGKEICLGKEFAEPAGVVQVPCTGKECFRGV